MMTPPRQNEVERLYQAALAAPVGARAALLAQASDAELQREVEARLDQTASMAAPLVAGRSLGRYRILARAGAGGMGEVYRARDTRLNRDVALKVLPPHLAAQPGFLARFEQEARAASALNHPHVVSTYDVGTEDGVAYIVSEFVDGQSLRQALHQKPMPLRTVLKVATELADGLAAAHRAGIVHRDLKPENVMLTSEGTAKIVDFGLALVLGNAGPHTLTGMVLGTPAYMSPEQAMSRPTDHRADQFALGAMLYEMICGHRAFRRDTLPQTLHAITTEEPPPLNDVPGPLCWLVQRCLAKDPRERYASTDDLYRDLRNLRDRLHEPQVTPTTPGAGAVKRGRLALWAAGAALAGAAVAALLLNPSEPAFDKYKLTPFVTEAGAEESPAWSPDGRSIAYSAEEGGIRQILMRGIEASASTQLTHSERDSLRPFWSPDGSRVYYSMAGGLWSVGAAGGTPQLAIKNVNFASIAPDGRALAFTRGGLGSLGVWIAAPPAGEPKQYRMAPFPEKVTGMHVPVFSRDGSKIAVLCSALAGAAWPDLWILPYPSGTPRLARVRLPYSLALGGRLSWMPDNRHLVMSGSIEDGSSHIYLLDTESEQTELLSMTSGDETGPSVSPDGRRIAFAAGGDDYDVVQFSLDGTAMTPLLATARSETHPTWTPTGTGYAYTTDARGAWEVWLRNVDGSARPLATPDTAFPWNRLLWSRLSPNGLSVAFDVFSDSHMVAIASVAGGRPVVLDKVSGDQHGASWSPDSNWIAYRRLRGAKWELVKAPVGGGAAVRIGEASEGRGGTTWSPDGNWICHYDRAGLLRVVSADGKVEKTFASTETESFGFSPDGETLYAVRRTAARKWELASLRVPDGAPQKSVPLNLPASATVAGFSLHPDGKSFLTSVSKPRYDIWLMEGFPQPRRWPFWRRP